MASLNHFKVISVIITLYSEIIQHMLPGNKGILLHDHYVVTIYKEITVIL